MEPPPRLSFDRLEGHIDFNKIFLEEAQTPRITPTNANGRTETTHSIQSYVVNDIQVGGRMINPANAILEGACTCGFVRYRVTREPMFVHCCHCRWCQRETGSAFAINALIEAENVVVLSGRPEKIHTPSASGQGQKITRCPKCHVALWSNYAGAGDAVHFVRVGTLQEPDRVPPNIHIFTSSKQPWVVLPENTPSVAEYYDRNVYWPKSSRERAQMLMSRKRLPE